MAEENSSAEGEPLDGVAVQPAAADDGDPAPIERPTRTKNGTPEKQEAVKVVFKGVLLEQRRGTLVVQLEPGARVHVIPSDPNGCLFSTPTPRPDQPSDDRAAGLLVFRSPAKRGSNGAA